MNDDRDRLRSKAGHRWETGATAFTLVELVVVITVIVIILAIAVPGLGSMQRDARMTAAQQNVNGVMMRAYTQSLADRSMTAVRFFPGAWDVAEDSGAVDPNRQHMAIYRYVGKTVQPSPSDPNAFMISPVEYFERVKELTSVKLPEDVWVAPVESLAKSAFGDPTNFGSNWVLPGTIGDFVFDANDPSTTFLNADDFLIVCDGEAGVRSGKPAPFRMRAVVPSPFAATPYEADNYAGVNYQRMSYAGVVTYRREPFVELGAAATGTQRQDYLRAQGRPYLVHRYSGALTEGVQRPN